MVSEDCCGNEASVITAELKRAALIRRAFQLEWLTVIWMMVETAVAIGAGIAAHSLLLFAFGIDSVIEIVSACVLIWRLSVELRAAGLSPMRLSAARAVLPARFFLRSPYT